MGLSIVADVGKQDNRYRVVLKYGLHGAKPQILELCDSNTKGAASYFLRKAFTRKYLAQEKIELFDHRKISSPAKINNENEFTTALYGIKDATREEALDFIRTVHTETISRSIGGEFRVIADDDDLEKASIMLLG